jgi:hypothetical protein
MVAQHKARLEIGPPRPCANLSLDPQFDASLAVSKLESGESEYVDDLNNIQLGSDVEIK